MYDDEIRSQRSNQLGECRVLRLADLRLDNQLKALFRCQRAQLFMVLRPYGRGDHSTHKRPRHRSDEFWHSKVVTKEEDPGGLTTTHVRSAPPLRLQRMAYPSDSAHCLCFTSHRNGVNDPPGGSLQSLASKAGVLLRS